MKRASKIGNSVLRELIKAELSELDKNEITVDGVKLKPSDCYRFDLSPNHVLFNTNCPDELREKVRQIIYKYTADESGTQE